jgi:hypothetical protein
MKIIIIIVLKPNLRVDLKQNSGHWSRLISQAELTRVSIRIKVIIIILNLIQKLIQDKP